MEILFNRWAEITPEQVGHEQWYRENHKRVADIIFESPVPMTENVIRFTERSTTHEIPCYDYQGLDCHGGYRSLNIPGDSYVQMDTIFRKNEAKQYILNLDHMSIQGQGVFTKITITVNGETVIHGYDAFATHWRFFQEQLDITSFLRDGYNTVRIQLDTDSQPHHLIRTMSIVEI